MNEFITLIKKPIKMIIKVLVKQILDDVNVEIIKQNADLGLD